MGYLVWAQILAAEYYETWQPQGAPRAVPKPKHLKNRLVYFFYASIIIHITTLKLIA